MSLASRPIVSSVVTDPFQYGIRFAEATYSLMMRHFHGTRPKRAPKEALAILARNGVPTSFPAETHRDHARWPWVTGGILAGLATLGGIIAFRRRSRSAPV
jgi:hypothetical protein